MRMIAQDEKTCQQKIPYTSHHGTPQPNKLLFVSKAVGAVNNRPKCWFSDLYVEWCNVGLRYVFAAPLPEMQRPAAQAVSNRPYESAAINNNLPLCQVKKGLARRHFHELHKALFVFCQKFPYFTLDVERRVTSWAPPSTMETEDTRVNLASRCRSGILVTPTLHMVERTLYRELSTLSWREPA